MGKDSHKVVKNAGDLCKQGPNPLGAFRDLNIQQLFDGQGKTLFVGHHGDIVEAVEVGHGLQVGFIFDQLLGAAVQQADMGVGAYDLLAVELEKQAQYAVGGGMLGPEVDGVMAHFTTFYRALVRCLCSLLGALVYRRDEVLVDGDEPRAMDILWLGIAAEAVRREGGGGGCP